MTAMTRIGLMGFGQVGRQLYHLASASDDIEIVAISDVAAPAVLHYLLSTDSGVQAEAELEGNYLRNGRFQTRMLQADRPGEVPWDVFNVDLVIDATNRFRSPSDMTAHLDAGAPRVMISQLPDDDIDRVVMMGINEGEVSSDDLMISAGSATTTALGLMLQIVSENFGLVSASMTTVHAYTSDQALQDYAGTDFRRSRSAAENIIPNANQSAQWLERIVPQYSGRLSGSALNVPVQKGSLLDLDVVVEDSSATVEQMNAAMLAAVERWPGQFAATDDPIVSSDVIGATSSVLFDSKGTVKAGKRLFKLLAWYESLGHAARMLDVARLYGEVSA